MTDASMEQVAAAVVRLGRISLDFGQVNRGTYHPDGTTHESDTTHTVMLTLISCALADLWYPRLDKGLIAQAASVHDVSEVYAGDTRTLRALTLEEKAAKAKREYRAFLRIAEETAELPWLALMIQSYEDQATPEMRLVKFVDKLVPKITHFFNHSATVREEGMTPDELAERLILQGQEYAAYAGEFPEVEQLRQILVGRVLDQFQSEYAVTTASAPNASPRTPPR